MAIVDNLDNHNFSRTNIFEGAILKFLLNRWAKRMDNNVSDRFVLSQRFNQGKEKSSWYPIALRTGKYELLIEVKESKQ